MKKVYVPNKSIHDFSAAEKYGRLVFLSEGNINKYATSAIFRSFKKRMKDSDEGDFLLVTGLNVLNIIASMILTQKHKQVNLLLFQTSGVKKDYIERVIKMEE